MLPPGFSRCFVCVYTTCVLLQQVCAAGQAGDAWRSLMEPTRQAAKALAKAGVIDITQKGQVGCSGPGWAVCWGWTAGGLLLRPFKQLLPYFDSKELVPGLACTRLGTGLLMVENYHVGGKCSSSTSAAHEQMQPGCHAKWQILAGAPFWQGHEQTIGAR